MRQKYIVNKESKSYLANLLATESLEVQYKKTATASFDVKNRILTLPIWKKDLSEPVTDLFVAHEVGHALYTPVSLLTKAHKQKINHSIVNVVEDARIEKLIKRRYNGLRQSFIRGYKELIAKNFFGTVDKDINDYLLIDRLNIHFKSSHISSNVQFTNEEMKFVKMIEELETPEDVIKVSKLLQKYCNAEREEKGRDQEINFDDHNFEEVNPDDLTDEEKENIEQDASNSNEKSDEESNEEGDATTSNKKDKEEIQQEGDPVSTGVAGKSDNLDQAISETDRNWESMRDTIVDKQAKNNEYAYLHKFNHKDIVVDYKDVIKDFNKHWADMVANGSRYYIDPDICKNSFIAAKNEYKKFSKRSLKTVMYLVKEFEQKKSAALYARASSDKTGVIDPLKLHSYKYADDVFKRLTIIPDGKNHGLMLLLDWSGSMHDKILPTVEQLINLTMFCRKINVPYEVYAFTNNSEGRRYHREFKDSGVKYKLGDTRIDGDFRLINWSSSRMNNKDYETNLFNLYALANTIGNRGRRFDGRDIWDDISYPSNYHMSSTPLNDALIAFHTLVPEFISKYNIDKMNTIILTDGYSDSGCKRYEPDVIMPDWDVSGHGTNTYFVSRKNKRQYKSNSSRSFTKNLIENLRYETGTKIVGFYIQSRKGVDMWQHQETHGKVDNGYYNVSEKTRQNLQQEWKKNKCIVTERGKHNTAYDEHYTIASQSMKVSDEAMATPSENAKTGELKRLFAKSRTGSLQSRFVLNRFIKLVA